MSMLKEFRINLERIIQEIIITYILNVLLLADIFE